jgi:hypothetical protein
VTQAFAQPTPVSQPATPAAATLVQALPAHDELRRLRQIRALRRLLERAAELEAET